MALDGTVVGRPIIKENLVQCIPVPSSVPGRNLASSGGQRLQGDNSRVTAGDRKCYNGAGTLTRLLALWTAAMQNAKSSQP